MDIPRKIDSRYVVIALGFNTQIKGIEEGYP
jgi:hypothetical protein